MPADEWPIWVAKWESDRWGTDRIIAQLSVIGARLLAAQGQSCKPDELIPKWVALTPEVQKQRQQQANARIRAWAKRHAKKGNDGISG